MITLAEAQRRNQQAGYKFWSDNNVKFFNHRDETEILEGNLFIYSIAPHQEPKARFYKVARFVIETSEVDNFSDELSNKFKTLAKAKKAVNMIRVGDFILAKKQILSLLKAEGVDPQDGVAALKVLEGCSLAKQFKRFYLDFIFSKGLKSRSFVA